MVEQQNVEPQKPPQSKLPQPFSLQRRKRLWLMGVGVSGLVVGGISAAALIGLPRWPIPAIVESVPSLPSDTDVLALVAQPVADRAATLEALAQGEPSLTRYRARYLLAADLIQQDRGGKALPWLEGLEQDYPVLAAQILAKRAQAYAATGDATTATRIWNQLRQDYPTDPATAEALYQLGKTDPAVQDQLLTQFPAHPRSIEIAVNRLQQNPKQPQLMLILARYGHYLPNIGTLLDRLKQEYAAQLTPEDWEALAFAYWEKTRYGSAGDAYANAPPTALNLYRAARGAQLDDRVETAITRYQALLQAFPTEPESGLALVRLAALVDKPETAIAYLDQAINTFPDRAPEALQLKAEILDGRNSPDTALQVRQSVLDQYPQSDVAAEFRWQQAQQQAKAGNAQLAWDWARQIVEQNPTSEYAPEAAFWAGKWATQVGQSEAATQAYEYVLATYPDSYYAWRSATLLGWDVGDFSTVRQKLPEVVGLTQRPDPLAGSETTRELYRLGQHLDAWSRWQVEFTNRVQPTVAEQFTDGLMRLGVNDNLEGIFMLSSLAFREKPSERQAYQDLKQTIGYWESLYPFPYVETIEQWAQQRQLNPMLVTALIRQESRFEATIESSAGAKGLMQVMPDTADWVAEQIQLKAYNLESPADNITLGTWYLDYTHREYSNNSLLAVASYNAGPNAVAEWVSKYGLTDPDQFVEQIPYDETKGYVKAVFENYWNYLRLYHPPISNQLSQHSPVHSQLVTKNSD